MSWPSEGEVQKKTTELRALRNQLILAAQRQANSELQAEDEKGMMREMLRQRVLLNDQITAFDQQIRNFGGAAPSCIARRNEVVSAYNGLGDRIRLLQSGPGADPKVQDRLLAELSRRREGYIQAVLNLRQLADAATKSYAELAEDAAVKEALESLGAEFQVEAQARSVGPVRGEPQVAGTHREVGDERRRGSPQGGRRVLGQRDVQRQGDQADGVRHRSEPDHDPGRPGGGDRPEAVAGGSRGALRDRGRDAWWKRDG